MVLGKCCFQHRIGNEIGIWDKRDVHYIVVLYYLYSSPSHSTIFSLHRPLEQLPTFDTTYQTPSDHARALAFD